MGRHRKPCRSSRTLAILATSTAIVPITSGVAWADGWDAIEHCESGGSPHAQNSHSTASGALQFLDSTWRSLGGTKYGARAMDATTAEQEQIAQVAFQRSGLTPWAASRSCWSGKTSESAIRSTSGGSVEAVTVSTRKRVHAPKSHTRTSESSPSAYVIEAGDTLSSIAASHGLNWRELYNLNRSEVSNPALIRVGEHLVLGA